ncbi:MAG TPA: TIGR02466 family protein [Gammaproteobacteria bacterium]|nr:TIGR02466 family protein [Gammaproteobacteria bacterium]
MDKTEIATVFPSVLLRTRVADHEAIAGRLLTEIESIRAHTPSGPAGGWACPVFSTLMTDPSLHRRQAFGEIADIFHTEVLALAELKSVDLEAQEIAIDRCWLNVLSRGQSMDVHSHPNSFYTGIYFLQAPADGPRLSLHNPANERGLSLPVKKETTLNQEYFIYQPVAGDLLIFDSYIAQSFQVHQSEQEHIHLTFTAAGPLSPVPFPSADGTVQSR